MLKTTAAVESPLQIIWFEIVFTCPFGLIVMVNIFEGPVQAVPPLLNEGVTVIVAVIGEVPLLIGVNMGILPEPLTGNPIVVLSIVQL